MVKRIVWGKQDAQSFQCEACGYVYATEDVAVQCQKWCTEHQSCNLEITKHALKEDDKGSEMI